jgi:DNA-binding LytR/AlgR family response regulator
MNCLIVEDEPLAAGVIKDYINQVPALHLCGCCEDAVSALEFIRNEKIDVIFLDINIPGINGLEMIKAINKKISIILTTAYNQHAVEAFDLNVTDYLMKPVEFGRFLKAINKLDRGTANLADSHTDVRKYYFFNSDKKRVKVFLDEINYVESLKDYIRIHTDEKKIVTRMQLGEFAQLAANKTFIRVHKSFIVNSEKISAFGASEIEVGNITLPIGKTYKEHLGQILAIEK